MNVPGARKGRVSIEAAKLTQTADGLRFSHLSTGSGPWLMPI